MTFTHSNARAKYLPKEYQNVIDLISGVKLFHFTILNKNCSNVTPVFETSQECQQCLMWVELV